MFRWATTAIRAWGKSRENQAIRRNRSSRFSRAASAITKAAGVCAKASQASGKLRHSQSRTPASASSPRKAADHEPLRSQTIKRAGDGGLAGEEVMAVIGLQIAN